MQPGALKGAWTDRPRPLGRFDEVLEAAAGIDTSVPRAAQYFGVAGIEYMEKFGLRAENFAKVQVKTRKPPVHHPSPGYRHNNTQKQSMEAPTPITPVQQPK